MKIKLKLFLATVPLALPPLALMAWLLHVERRNASLRGEGGAFDPTGYYILLLAATLGLIAGLAYVAGHISRRLAQLGGVAKRAGTQDEYLAFPHSVGGDEIDEVACNVDQMAKCLDARFQQLRASEEETARELERVSSTLAREVEERARAAQLARQASASKSDFIATMSHEMRTPMNGVLGVTDELLSLDLDKALRERVEMIKVSGETLMRLLDDILDFSKIEANKLEIKLASFDLRLACRAVHLLFRARAREKGLIYRIEIHPDVPQFVVGDSVRVRQILANLLSNAVKYTDRGEVALEVKMDKRKRQGISFSVSDTGVGIPKGEETRMFELFAQASTNYERQGTGLGLAISKRLAELMEGEVDFRSQEGEGSVFTFWMPYFEGVPVQDSTEWPSEIEPVENVRVLLAEDNQINQHVIASLLRRANHQLSLASDGAEAVELAKKEPFDLVLMDCRMPKLDGFEATRRIRELPADHFNRNVPIVALTANAFAQDRVLCFECGMNNFITKPVDRATLLRIINFYGHHKAATS